MSELYTKFSQRDSSVYNFHDIDSLTIFADNVIPAMLTDIGFIKPCSRVRDLV